jgi:uncharacterized protein YkwD
MVSLSVLLGVFSAAAGTWMATAEGNTAELGAAALVLPNAPGAGSGSGTEVSGREAQPHGGQPAAPTTSAAAPTTSSAPPSPSETSATPTPTSTAAAPTTTKAAARIAPDSSITGQVIALVNDERTQAGCQPLADESHLTKAAQDYSDDMAARNFFAHTNPEGVTFDQRIKTAGYSKPGAENIAKGQTSAAQVMDSWMNSEGHRANILNCSLTKIGVGFTKAGNYWVQDFGY